MKLLHRFGVLCVLSLGLVETEAHHAVQAQFDVNDPRTLTGVMTLVEMINPHPYFHLDVERDNGSVESWSMEAPALNVLRRAGLLKTLRVGEVYTLEYYPSRNGDTVGLMTAVTLPDGRRLVTIIRDPGSTP